MLAIKDGQFVKKQDIESDSSSYNRIELVRDFARPMNAQEIEKANYEAEFERLSFLKKKMKEDIKAQAKRAKEEKARLKAYHTVMEEQELLNRASRQKNMTLKRYFERQANLNQMGQVDFDNRDYKSSPLTRDGAFGPITDFERIVKGQDFDSSYTVGSCKRAPLTNNGDFPNNMSGCACLNFKNKNMGCAHQQMGDWSDPSSWFSSDSGSTEGSSSDSGGFWDTFTDKFSEEAASGTAEGAADWLKRSIFGSPSTGSTSSGSGSSTPRVITTQTSQMAPIPGWLIPVGVGIGALTIGVILYKLVKK